jgi:hypothetical protein
MHARMAASHAFSRADADPRVCPFCPAVAVPSQVLIFVFSEKDEKKKGSDRHLK